MSIAKTAPKTLMKYVKWNNFLSLNIKQSGTKIIAKLHKCNGHLQGAIKLSYLTSVINENNVPTEMKIKTYLILSWCALLKLKYMNNGMMIQNKYK